MKHSDTEHDTTSVPELLTPDEAIKLLGLDRVGLKSPRDSLRHLRRTRQIGYVKVSGKVLIPREEVISYIRRKRVEPLD
jgi:hypothetical protein